MGWGYDTNWLAKILCRMTRVNYHTSWAEVGVVMGVVMGEVGGWTQGEELSQDDQYRAEKWTRTRRDTTVYVRVCMYHVIGMVHGMLLC